MKAAQENSAVAVVCLAFGLLIANVGLPERRRADTEIVAPSEPVIQITPVGALEGRLLERSLVSFGGNVQAFTEHKHKVSEPFSAASKHLASSELKKLAGHQDLTGHAGHLPDKLLLLVLLVSIVVGFVLAAVDRKEMLDDAQNESANLQPPHKSCDAPKQEINPVSTPSDVFLHAPAIVGLLVGSVLAIFLMIACRQDHLAPSGNAVAAREAELRNIAEVTLNTQPGKAAVLSDSTLLAMLGAFALLGVACMRCDREEMEAEPTAPSGCDGFAHADIQPAANAHEPAPSRRRALSSCSPRAIFLIMVCSGIFLCLPSQLALHTSVEMSHAQESQELAQFAYNPSNPRHAHLSDSAVLVLLGISAAIGAACMRSDHEDIANEPSDFPENSATSNSPENHAELASESAAPPTFGRSSFSMLVVVAIMLTFVFCGSLLCFQGDHDVQGSLESADSADLSELAQLSSSPSTPYSVRLSDSLLVAALAISAAIGAACMRSDRDDLSKEQSKSSTSVAPGPSRGADEPSNPSENDGTSNAHGNHTAPLDEPAARHSFRRCFFFLVAILLVLCSCGIAVCLRQHVCLGNSAKDVVDRELVELAQLAHYTLNPRPALLSDGALMLLLGISAAIGAACISSDGEEIANEPSAPSESDVAENSHQNYAARLDEPAAPHCFGRCLLSLAAMFLICCCCGIVVCLYEHVGLGSSVEVVVDRELEELAQLAHTSMNPSPAWLTDSALVLVLGLTAAIGAACMRSDRDELAKESSTPSNIDAIASAPDNHAAPDLEPVPLRTTGSGVHAAFVVAVIFLALACVLCPLSQLGLGSSVGVAGSPELRELAQLSKNSSNPCHTSLSDSALVLVLGIGAAIGAACMRSDHEDIANEPSDFPENDATSNSPENLAELASESAAPPTFGPSSFSMLAVVAIMLTFVFCGSLLCFQGDHDVQGSLESADSADLSELAQLSSSPSTRYSVRLSDSLLVAALAISAAIGAACMCSDREELAKESSTPSFIDVIGSAPQKRAAPSLEPAALCTARLGAFTPSGLAAILLALIFCGSVLCPPSQRWIDSSDAVAASPELSELTQLAKSSSNPCHTSPSDRALALLLGIAAALGAACMRSDRHEMAKEEPSTPSENDSATALPDVHAASIGFGDVSADLHVTSEHRAVS